RYPPFLYNHPPPPAPSTLSLHDALPISRGRRTLGVRQLDEQVELARRHVEVVAQALVPRPEQLAEPVEVRARGVLERGDAGADSDRKSTRLNSSHRTISYAVFCLKKKKK